MTELVRIKPVFAILCDDIRKEDNGKLIFIGVYPHGINIRGSGPSVLLKMGLCIFFEASKRGRSALEIQLITSDGNKANIRADIDILEPTRPKETNSLFISNLVLNVTKSDNISVLFRHPGEKEWKTLRTLPTIVEIAKDKPILV